MLRVNHFPLRSDLRVVRSCYRHNNARAYCGYLRSQGFDPTQEAGQVVVYHAEGIEPDNKRIPNIREIVSASSARQKYDRAINAHLGQLLRGAGFIRVDRREHREYISPSDHVRSLVIEERGPSLPLLNVRAHLRWTWDLEWCEGASWLVPLPGRCCLTAQEPRFPALMHWLRRRLSNGERIKGIDLKTGKHRTLALRGDQWGTEWREGWEPLEGDGWRVCLDMQAMKRLGYSVDARHSAEFTFDDLLAEVQSSPFKNVVDTADPLLPTKARADKLQGQHLRMRKGKAGELKDVHRLGILEHPPRPIRLLAVASKKESDEAHKRTRRVLGAHLIDRPSLINQEGGNECLRSVGADDGHDTIATIWTTNKYNRGFRLPMFSLAKTRLHLYEPKTGDLIAISALQKEVKSANSNDETLIALVLLDDDLAKPAHDCLMRQLCGVKALPIKFSSIEQRSRSVERTVEPKWLNVSLKLAQKSGAVPWDLTALPGVDEQTVFLGIDLGHDHSRDRSKIALALFDHRGRPIGDGRVIPCDRNNERIPCDVFHREFRSFVLDRDGPEPTQVIVHRDGRFLDGELNDLIDALEGVPRLSIVSIKKDTCTRLSGERLEGSFVELSDRRMVLVTNSQSQRRSMPKPIEVELVSSNQHNLRQAASQVYWLSRVCQGNAYFPTRLPATTGRANNLARTGYRV